MATNKSAKTKSNLEQIIENIKSDRKELISKYNIMRTEIETLSESIKQARKMSEDVLYDNLWDKRAELQYQASEFVIAINGLGSALNHLGESVETFWK